MKKLVICNSPDEGRGWKLRAMRDGRWIHGSLVISSADQLRGVRVWEYEVVETALAYASRHYISIKEELFLRRKFGKKAVDMASARGEMNV